MTRPHIVEGEFQSDKYPTCPPGSELPTLALRTHDPHDWDVTSPADLV